MKTKFKLQSIIFLFLIFTSLTCLNWYANIGVVREYENVESRELTKQEIEKIIVNPNSTKVYYVEKKTLYTGTNSMIPFIVNKQLISESKPEIISRNH